MQFHLAKLKDFITKKSRLIKGLSVESDQNKGTKENVFFHTTLHRGEEAKVFSE